MCIPPADEEPALHFALLREIARRNDLELLSMGMSADYETAIRFGATMCASAARSSEPGLSRGDASTGQLPAPGLEAAPKG